MLAKFTWGRANTLKVGLYHACPRVMLCVPEAPPGPYPLHTHAPHAHICTCTHTFSIFIAKIVVFESSYIMFTFLFCFIGLTLFLTYVLIFHFHLQLCLNNEHTLHLWVVFSTGMLLGRIIVTKPSKVYCG